MFNNSSKILFFSTLVISTMTTVSANSWLSAWMGLEINLLSFIPLMSDSNNLMSSEASLKYFLTQALASSILLFSIIISMIEKNLTIDWLLDFPSLMIVSTLVMKTGAAPFHFWFPLVMEGLTWTNSMILMTWQKLAPLMLISYMSSNFFLEFSTMASVVIGSLGGLNQTSLRKLMAYSSINHLGWMMISISTSEMLWMNYFCFYSFLSISVISVFLSLNLSFFNQLFTLPFHSFYVKFIFFVNVLSMGGLPPLLGFFPKWMTIQALSLNNQLFVTFFLVIFSLLTLFFYLRMGYSSFMIGHTESNWNVYFPLSFNMVTLLVSLSFISSTGLMMISLFFWLF